MSEQLPAHVGPDREPGCNVLGHHTRHKTDMQAPLPPRHAPQSGARSLLVSRLHDTVSCGGCVPFMAGAEQDPFPNNPQAVRVPSKESLDPMMCVRM